MLERAHDCRADGDDAAIRLFGLSPFEHAARLRVRDGIHRLRTSSLSVEAAARLAGYRSGNKFYQRLKRYTDLRPSQIRTMPHEALARLLDQRLSLRRLAALDVARARGVNTKTDT